MVQSNPIIQGDRKTLICGSLRSSSTKISINSFQYLRDNKLSPATSKDIGRMGQESSTPVDESTPPQTLNARSIEAIASYIKEGRAKKIVLMVSLLLNPIPITLIVV